MFAAERRLSTFGLLNAACPPLVLVASELKDDLVRTA